ncbi:hypothetical protein CYMTET_40744 [Cymbomonas tetramitiformis]|uniref:Uncharacterized protein n=1 Tax=Cymbomonas tetramitiformis TaxID=36881 RepID=A0AAE0F3B9_9CHLO|nr:hypothetical protein CYMTET_40744 [Cymbomonas tetramitiformis]
MLSPYLHAVSQQQRKLRPVKDGQVQVKHSYDDGQLQVEHSYDEALLKQIEGLKSMYKIASMEKDALRDEVARLSLDLEQNTHQAAAAAALSVKKLALQQERMRMREEASQARTAAAIIRHSSDTREGTREDFVTRRSSYLPVSADDVAKRSSFPPASEDIPRRGATLPTQQVSTSFEAGTPAPGPGPGLDREEDALELEEEMRTLLCLLQSSKLTDEEEEAFAAQYRELQQQVTAQRQQERRGAENVSTRIRHEPLDQSLCHIEMQLQEARRISRGERQPFKKSTLSNDEPSHQQKRQVTRILENQTVQMEGIMA